MTSTGTVTADRPVRLLGRPALFSVVLDDGQRAAVTSRAPVVQVIGAPGTGKTTVVAHSLLHRLSEVGSTSSGCLALVPDRRRAEALRDAIQSAGGFATSQPLVRTPVSFALTVLRAHAERHSLPAPRLLTGVEQDRVVAELLAGHAGGIGRRPDWPHRLHRAVGTRAFRNEVRDLLGQTAELGIGADGLRRLGVTHDRPEWVAAAAMIEEYLDVTALSLPGAWDPAAAVRAAAEVLTDDEQVSGRLRAELGAVVVDDAQELGGSGVELLRALASNGITLLLAADPDATTQGFRGADPGLMTEAGSRWAGHQVILPHCYRQGHELARAGRQVLNRLGSAGTVRHRSPSTATGPAEPGGCLTVAIYSSAAEEARAVCASLRRAHLLDHVPWSQLAVVVRSVALAEPIRRMLVAQHVPVVVPGVRTALPHRPAARALLDLVAVCEALAAGRPDPLTDDLAGDLLLSPIGGLDPQALLTLARRFGPRQGGSTPQRPGPLAALLTQTPTEALDGGHGGSVRRLSRAVTAGAQLLVDVPGSSAHEVLWEIWQALELAEPWRAAAAGSGPAAQRANRDLDDVVALFDVAAAAQRQTPGLGVAGFLADVGSQSVPADLLAPRATPSDAVTVTTPAGAVGRQWRRVVIAHVQEHSWPDQRIRGALLGAGVLADVEAGRPTSRVSARAALQQDELRLFYVALTRASESLLVTAVHDDRVRPSPLVALQQPDAHAAGDADPVPSHPSHGLEPMTLPDAVAHLRRVACGDGSAQQREHAARQLAALAQRGVRGAHPREWWTLRTWTSRRPRRPEGAPVTISPSQLPTFERCQLEWLLTSSGGQPGDAGNAAAVGALVHRIAEEVDLGDPVALDRALDERWGELRLPPGWSSDRQLVAARVMLTRIAAHHREASEGGWQVEARELPARLTVGRATVTGRLDRLERNRDGRLRVVDIKTGTSKPTRDQVRRHPQLGAYQVLTGALAGGASVSAGMLQVGRAAAGTRVDLQLQPPVSEDEQPHWATDLLTRTADAMAGPDVRAQAGQWCRSCVTRTCCPLLAEGRRVT